jgi:hypothetical protein
MTKFLIGLLLGLILGIGGASAFLITAGGGDYFVGASPRVRELEASLREADQERQWLRGRLGEATQLGSRLESRFISLAARFEALSGVPAPKVAPTRTAPQPPVKVLPPLAPSPSPSPTQSPVPAASPATDAALD